MNGATDDYIRLALFPFTLRDKAKKWLGSLPRDSITSWSVMSKLFLTRFFPHKRTAKIRTQITSFKQRLDEPLNEAWERFRELQYACPHYGIPDWLIVQTFYDGLTDNTRTSIDDVVGGALMDRGAQEAMVLIDNMAMNQQWSGRDNSRGSGGRYDVDQLTALIAKMDAIQKAFDKISVKVVVNHQPPPCAMCGDEGHSYEYYPLAQRDEETEQVNSLNNETSYFPKPLFNQSYSNDRGEQQNWRYRQNNPLPFNNASSSNNNRNFFNNASFSNSNNHVFQHVPSKPYVAPAVSDFMHEQGRMNQLMFKQMQTISAQLTGLAAQNKELEKQRGPQATSSQLQPGMLPSQTEPNPRGDTKAITLRSGAQYQEPMMSTDSADQHTDRAQDATRPVYEKGQSQRGKESEENAEDSLHTNRAHLTWLVQEENQNQRRGKQGNHCLTDRLFLFLKD